MIFRVNPNNRIQHHLAALWPELTDPYYLCNSNTDNHDSLSDSNPPHPNTTKDSVDDPQHHTPNQTTLDSQLTHSEQAFYNLLKSLQELASQNRTTTTFTIKPQQRSPTQSTQDNAPSSTIYPCTKESCKIALVLPLSQLTHPGE